MYRELVELSQQPAQYEIVELPGGVSRVYFYTDAQQVETTGEGEGEGERWQAVRWSIDVPSTPGLSARIENNLEAWLTKTQQAARDRTAEAVRSQRDALYKLGDGMLNLTRAGIVIPEQITTMTLLTTVKSVFDGLRDLINGPWAQYQQALRDVPQQEGFPFNVIWPTPPGEAGDGE